MNTEDDTFRILRKQPESMVDQRLSDFSNSPESHIGFYELHNRISNIIIDCGWSVDEYEATGKTDFLRGIIFSS